jgi:acetyl/propionyl-CoA carboxylase alpha subunit
MSKIQVILDGRHYEVEVRVAPGNGGEVTAVVNGEALPVTMPGLHDPTQEIEWVAVSNRSYKVVLDRDLRWLQSFGGVHQLEIHDMEAAVTRPASGDGRVKAPIPGMIARLLVEPGERVELGQPLLVLEAMKMENEIRAPRAGEIAAINVAPGQNVMLHTLLVDIV